ncbi:NAD(P)/FAD-dependent oxidoreductase [Corynebacterium sp. MSK039]|uniref:NAD(P)/FAD-dependent oxidoreductase n=1 Tax=Corynebacterium sp. MSK039 TaxID=3050193 RepID=UPI002551B7C2|nr:NAD(P)/FAD-dependent oxidoreductase [Corynebacterium sp. MSK039]MDK8790673.1 NAD(P)/FAD-dependent oxidoreductase [Corynebacterium sp. MSK039]
MTEVAIIGAGMAGLAAARTLSQAGVRCTLFDAADRVGGLVRSEQHGEITVDRGLQFFNTWYPAVKEILNPGEYSALKIKNFQPGINTVTREGSALIIDPVRAPSMVPKLLRSEFSSALRLGELVRMRNWLRSELMHRSSLELRGPSRFGHASDEPVAESLTKAGITGPVRQNAVDPILRAFLYDHGGETSAEFAKWVFVTLLRGTLALPERGMGDLAATMGRLGGVRVELNSQVSAVDVQPNGVELTVNGKTERFSHAIVATSAQAAHELIGTAVPEHRGQSTWWFTVSDEVHSDRLVTVDGSGELCIDLAGEVTSVAPAYAPGSQLIAAATSHPHSNGDFDAARDLPTEMQVRRDVASIYDCSPEALELVTRHDIPDALPLVGPNHAIQAQPAAELLDGRVAVAGAHTATSTIDGAIRSGQRSARAIAELLAEK